MRHKDDYYSHMTTMIFEAFRVMHHGIVVVETLHYGEAMKVAREGSSRGKWLKRQGKWIVQRTASQNHYTPVGYWEDGIWYD